VASHPPIVLVGPTHPYTGGIAQHTTRLALELEGAGIPVVVESWKAQYPKALYPGSGRVEGEPEVGRASHVNETLAWYSPWSWWRVGRRHRGSRIIVSIPTAFHALPYTVMRWGAGSKGDMWGIVHNVTPHDSGKLSKTLMGFLLRSLNHLIVHGDTATDDAIALGVRPEAITVTALPSPWPEGGALVKPANTGPLRALFFGTIRPYKGLDVLLEALAQVPGTTLTVAGEFWEPREPYDELISRLGLSDRVTILPGYVPAEDFEGIFSNADVMVLPYRRGTGSIVKEVGFRFGLPVIATRVGAISDGIDHDVNGLVISPESVDELAKALRSAGDPATLTRWRKVIARMSGANKKRWADYVTAVTSA
jgi:D-inositol-3-phosphate glycosyltransferase